MKVQPGGPVNFRGQEGAKDTAQEGPKGPESKFGKALKEKSAKGHVGGGDAPLPVAGVNPFAQPVQGVQTNVEGVAAPARARTVDAVAGEIEVHVRGDVKEVTIQFDSKVLDGLEVRVRKEGGAIAVELLTRTARAHETVRGGVDQLTASLQAKGIAVASVRVQAAERWGETSRERGGGHQGRGGGQQRGRQGEDR